MADMNTSQARAVDEIITAVARGYTSQKASVANVLFPTVTVQARGGRIMSFNADGFKLIGTARAPSANTKRIQTSYSLETYALIDHRLEGSVPREMLQEAANGPGIDLAAHAIARVQDRMALEREKLAADLARDPAKYGAGNKRTFTAGEKWTNPASDPFADIIIAKEAIRSQIGEEPNALALSPKSLSALRTHPKVLDRLSTSTDRAPATLLQLQALFELTEIVKGSALFQGPTGTLDDVWGKDAILAYTTPKSMQEMGSPSYGYTYQLAGNPYVEEAYYDNNTATWYYPYSDAYQPVLAGPSAGFLFIGAVA